jgi:hypothetical protein
MCFGPVASFTASGVLLFLGTAVLRNIRSRKEFLFAAFPILFGLQQAIEGLLWTMLQRAKPPPQLLHGLAFAFIHAYVSNCSIRYETFLAGAQWFTGVYFAVTVLPYFISSQRAILIFGVPNLILGIIAFVFYRYVFISVWCFFAAVLSLSLYVFLRKLHHEPVLPLAPA